MNVLIIAEKPSVALRIAQALGNGAPRRIVSDSVSYYEISGEGSLIYVVAAVGHIFTIRQKGTGGGYPVLDVEWAPSYEVSKTSYYTKKYLDTIASIAPKCQRIINACDFDIEGTVIGVNIIKFLTGGRISSNAMRMKFSTTTSEELRHAYVQLLPLDMDNYMAGETRHMLDWLWGINLSRALMRAARRSGTHAVLSIGRVQGPTLALLAAREKAIAGFVPKPYWRIVCTLNGVKFTSVKGDIEDRNEAALAHMRASAAGTAAVQSVDEHESVLKPAAPFDLTALQLEANRILKMDPSRTLAVAQSLYERSYISYPRTSSQKLPQALGLRRVITELGRMPEFEELARKLITEGRFAPAEGPKSDEAHPAIYPTGVMPRNLSDEESALYRIIVRRFLACFARHASVHHTRVRADLGGEVFGAEGKRLTEPGWLEFYPYSMPDEQRLPAFSAGERIEAHGVELEEHKTSPPKRYSKASLIAELERKRLGTKATRATIIDTLFKRNYIEGKSIRVSEFGMGVYEVLRQNCAMILDAATTAKLEEDMELIAKGERPEGEVIEEGKELLLKALTLFDKNMGDTARLMQESMRAASVLGTCQPDGGDLVVKRSKAGKQFVGCANYPACTQTYPLPQNGMVVPLQKACVLCKTPIVGVIRGSRRFEMDLDPLCLTKKDWGKRASRGTQARSDAASAAPGRGSGIKVSSAAAGTDAKQRRGRTANKRAHA